MRLLWKLLRCHLSMAQTVGFTLAGLVGMAIVLTALQAYRDVLPVFDRPDSFMRGDYLVLSKQVGALQAIGTGQQRLYGRRAGRPAGAAVRYAKPGPSRLPITG